MPKTSCFSLMKPPCCTSWQKADSGSIQRDASGTLNVFNGRGLSIFLGEDSGVDAYWRPMECRWTDGGRSWWRISLGFWLTHPGSYFLANEHRFAVRRDRVLGVDGDLRMPFRNANWFEHRHDLLAPLLKPRR